jgi:chemotaxis protein MotB
MCKRAALALAPFALAACVSSGTHQQIKADLERKLADQKRECERLGSDLKECQAGRSELGEKFRLAKESLERLQSSLGQANVARKGEEAKVAALSQDLIRREEELRKKDEELRRKEGALRRQESELAASTERIRSLEAQLDRLRAIFDDLRAKLDALVKAGKLTLRMANGLLVVNLPERILFPSGSARLKREGREAIESVADILRRMKHRWQVGGHTDDVGGEKYNWLLSSRRAFAVLDVMLKAGMPSEQVSMAGFGQFQPVAPNDGPENRALNRRTELLLVPNLEEILAPVRTAPAPAR